MQGGFQGRIYDVCLDGLVSAGFPSLINQLILYFDLHPILQSFAAANKWYKRMENSRTPEQKEGRGCLFILGILLGCFFIAGIFFVVAGKLFGEENRHLVFFGTLGLGIVVFLSRELFSGRK